MWLVCMLSIDMTGHMDLGTYNQLTIYASTMSGVGTICEVDGPAGSLCTPKALL